MSDDRSDPGHDLTESSSAVPQADESAETETVRTPPDLDLIEADLADVEVALERLDAGEYWRDEATGEPLGDALLEERPTARRRS